MWFVSHKGFINVKGNHGLENISAIVFPEWAIFRVVGEFHWMLG